MITTYHDNETSGIAIELDDQNETSSITTEPHMECGRTTYNTQGAHADSFSSKNSRLQYIENNKASGKPVYVLQYLHCFHLARSVLS